LTETGLVAGTAYLKACEMLGVNPNTGERWSDDDEDSKLKEKLEKWKREQAAKQHKSYDRWQVRETTKQRAKRERKERIDAWEEHAGLMQREHQRLSDIWAERRSIWLRMSEGGD
jgi:hypothetical protein